MMYLVLDYMTSNGNVVKTIRKEEVEIKSPDSLPLKMGPIRCPETSINNYHMTPRNIPEERRSHQHRGGSLKSRKRLYPNLVSYAPTFLQVVKKITNNLSHWPVSGSRFEKSISLTELAPTPTCSLLSYLASPKLLDGFRLNFGSILSRVRVRAIFFSGSKTPNSLLKNGYHLLFPGVVRTERESDH
jgi:hypothetical protein